MHDPLHIQKICLESVKYKNTHDFSLKAKLWGWLVYHIILKRKGEGKRGGWDFV